jgi:vacuolar-type H+-ATPase subunit H
MMMPLSIDYSQTLKNIKDAEEAGNREIAEKKRVLAEELQLIQEEAAKSIAAAKADAEAYVAKEVEKARSAAQVEADKIVESVAKEAEQIAARKLDKSTFKRIIEEVLLSEFKGE